MKREMLKMELEKELKYIPDASDVIKVLQNPETPVDQADFIIQSLCDYYRKTQLSGTLMILILGLWSDMEELVKLESLRKKLRFLDMDKFPEIYFAYTLLISGETDPEAFGCIIGPMMILNRIQKEFPELTFRKAIAETVKEMIKEKYKRQKRYIL